MSTYELRQGCKDVTQQKTPVQIFRRSVWKCKYMFLLFRGRSFKLALRKSAAAFKLFSVTTSSCLVTFWQPILLPWIELQSVKDSSFLLMYDFIRFRHWQKEFSSILDHAGVQAYGQLESSNSSHSKEERKNSLFDGEWLLRRIINPFIIHTTLFHRQWIVAVNLSLHYL